ncbi:MAG: hypothetical protein GX579_14770 [Chloroflexi bacterium]|nr:hypothetical protein [Chloroflexota bacterium]
MLQSLPDVMLLFILKLLVVLVFLVAFLRNPRPFWGVGLLTVATAFLLDTFLSTFGWETVQNSMGFFFYVLVGALAGAAAAWIWSLLRPVLGTQARAPVATMPATPSSAPLPRADGRNNLAFDRRELYDQIRERLGTEDMRDLAFDLQIHENDVFSPGYSATESIVRLMDVAEARGKSADLALAVERILTPIAAADLPRPEKLSPQSPPTVLRHYLLANMTQDELAALAGRLGIDWEQLGSSKREVARNLLLHLQRRSRLHELIAALQPEEAAEQDDA